MEWMQLTLMFRNGVGCNLFHTIFFTQVLYTESVSNPTLTVSDLPRLAALAHSRPGAAAQLVVDNTFMPCAITPSHHGADVVVHSLTKFISGASDIIAGAVCGSAAFINSLMDFHTGKHIFHVGAVSVSTTVYIVHIQCQVASLDWPYIVQPAQSEVKVGSCAGGCVRAGRG